MSTSQLSRSPSPATALDDSYIDDDRMLNTTNHVEVEGDAEMDDPTPMPSPVADVPLTSSKAPCASQRISTQARLSTSPYPSPKAPRENKNPTIDPLKIRIPRINTTPRLATEAGPSYASILSAPAQAPSQNAAHHDSNKSLTTPANRVLAQPANATAPAPMAGHGESNGNNNLTDPGTANLTTNTNANANAVVPAGTVPHPQPLPPAFPPNQTHTENTGPFEDTPDEDMAEPEPEVFFPPGLHLMPVPEGGFPTVYGLDSDVMWEYVEPACYTTWKSAPENKVLVYIASDRPVTDVSDRLERIRSFTSVLFPDTPLTIGCARPRRLYNSEYKPVFPYLIAGLSEQQAHTITAREVWSTRQITLFATPFDVPVSSYALALHGIFLAPTTESEIQITEVVANTIRDSLSAMNLIAAHNDNIENSDNLNVGVKQEYIISTIDVRGETYFVNKKRNSVFFVYIQPPMKAINFHRTWLRTLRRLKYTTIYGQGEHRTKGWRCNLCKGLDHPTSLCRFPTIPGWNQPPHFADEGNDEEPDTQNNTNLPPSTSARGRGRGTRNNNGNRRGNPRGRRN
ncbi:hypothetical protein M378DRAFT_181641 [Amanita muscaria Koide BX008]|uniref:Uncharacterized protein n=1 Tax=Amanita muscaria (strain Koide BX008) TaxID=946122 RepID=A0A0C2STT6_AMAMK|nr:hypothetical protein M378DRAFT_18732 [Amanita muscaria Koide BX008]KIL57449.1 hypothetical protein M378DRAFT_181641 [Amanita muscaria Koide BX008]